MSDFRVGDRIVVGKHTDTLDFDHAKACAEALTKHYPGYAWAVNVSSETGMVQVRNLTLSGDWGFNIHLARINSDPSLKVVIQAGGEILERYKVKRGKIDQDEVDSLPTDFIGRHIPDTIAAVPR